MHVRRPALDRKSRFGQVGCGHFEGNHFDASKARAAGRGLTDVCAPAPLTAAVARTGAREHANLPKTLAATQAECTILAMPSSLHPAQAIESACAGCEGPLPSRLDTWAGWIA